MSDSRPPQNARSNRRPAWWRWHRRLGVGFAVLFLLVIVTGIALNHTEGLKLDQRTLAVGWVYDWYGMAPKGEPTAFYAGTGWAAEWGGTFFWNGVPRRNIPPLRGAMPAGDLLVVATTESVLLLTTAGEEVETLNRAHLPGAPQRLGGQRTAWPVVLETDQGWFATNTDFLEWQPIERDAPVVWSQAGSLPASDRERMERNFRGEGISLYRVLLDLHSGRFFGQAGVWLVDLSALALAFLTLSGVWYAWRIKR